MRSTNIVVPVSSKQKRKFPNGALVEANVQLFHNFQGPSQAQPKKKKGGVGYSAKASRKTSPGGPIIVRETKSSLLQKKFIQEK